MSDPQTKAQKNIRRLYAVSAANGALFLIPVLVPFFTQNGLSVGEVFFLQGVFALALMILEIPTGYLSDRWGRKNTIVAGSIFGVVGMAVYALSYGFWGFFTAEILLAFLVSFHSGTIEAMIYDSLLEDEAAHKYRKVVGNNLFVGFGSQATASIMGGILAFIALRATVWATLVALIFGLLAALTLREPSRHKMQETKHFKAMRDIVVGTLYRNAPLRSIIVLYAVLSSSTLALMWFNQPYQVMVKLPLALFGVTHALIMLGTAFASKSVHRIEKKIDDRVFLTVAGAVVIASYIVLGFVVSIWGIVFIFLGRGMYGFFGPLTTDLVNRMADSKTRATVLSIKSFGQRLLFAAFSPVLGYMADAFTLNQSLLFTGIAMGFAFMILLFSMNLVWDRIPKKL